jgi:hypothetical protein
VPIDHVVTHEVCPVSETQVDCVFDIFRVAKPIADISSGSRRRTFIVPDSACDEDGIDGVRRSAQFAKIVARISPELLGKPLASRLIETAFYFGLTEIVAVAAIKATGETTHVKIHWDRTH